MIEFEIRKQFAYKSILEGEIEAESALEALSIYCDESKENLIQRKDGSADNNQNNNHFPYLYAIKKH